MKVNKQRAEMISALPEHIPSVVKCDCCQKPVAKTYEVAGMELCAECISAPKEQAS